MINIIPDWLQDAVDFLNRKFPEDENVNLTILYGFDVVSTGEDECGFAVYHTDTKTIMLADFNELYEVSESEMKEIAITNLFHEYRHHQQNTQRLDLSEDDAESFAGQMYEKFISLGGDGYDYTDLIGGRHSDGMGWNPNGIFCGECASQTCEDCEQRFIKSNFKEKEEI